MSFQSIAFAPWCFRSLRLRNRIVMAPMTRRMVGEDGLANSATVAYYRRRAAAEVGLIVSEGTHIDDTHAPDTLNVPRLETKEQAQAWRRVVEAVQAEGGSFAPQLWHTGVRALNPIGPVEMKNNQGRLVQAMTEDIIASTIARFVQAALHAREIGCDALEIHAAHGYLLDSFLDPAVNTRQDAYGGNEENRMRFPREVIRAVRSAVGADFVILLRLSQWAIENYAMQKFPDSTALSRHLKAFAEDGADVFHLSTRRATDPAFPDEHATRTLAGWARHFTDRPVIAVGGVALGLPMDQSYGDAVSPVADPSPALCLVDSGECDLLAVGRSLIANPDWVQVVRDQGWQALQPYHKGLLENLF